MTPPRTHCMGSLYSTPADTLAGGEGMLPPPKEPHPRSISAMWASGFGHSGWSLLRLGRKKTLATALSTVLLGLLWNNGTAVISWCCPTLITSSKVTPTSTASQQHYNSQSVQCQQLVITWNIDITPGQSKKIFRTRKFKNFGTFSGHRTTQTRWKSAIKVI